MNVENIYGGYSTYDDPAARRVFTLRDACIYFFFNFVIHIARGSEQVDRNLAQFTSEFRTEIYLFINFTCDFFIILHTCVRTLHATYNNKKCILNPDTNSKLSEIKRSLSLSLEVSLFI